MSREGVGSGKPHALQKTERHVSPHAAHPLGESSSSIGSMKRATSDDTTKHRSNAASGCVVALGDAEQLAHRKLVGRREIVALELARGHPTKIGDVDRLRLAAREL